MGLSTRIWFKLSNSLEHLLVAANMNLGAISKSLKNLSKSKLGEIYFGNRNAKAFEHLLDYFRIQPIAGYIGWLGYKNFGDEVIYEAFNKLFPQLKILLYTDYKRVDSIELILYRKFIKRQNFYNFVFLGGGTLINRQLYLDWFQHALERGHQGIVFGTGVCDPSFWSEQRPDINYTQMMADWVAVLQKVTYVSVRGPKSARILESHGISQPKVIGDPALSACTPRSPNSPKNRRLAINLGSHGFIWGSQEKINEVIAKLAKYFLRNGWQVEFIPMHPIDFQIGLDMIQRFDLHEVSIWKDFQNIDETINRIKTYDILVGQRLHSVVIACGCGVPAIALEYQPKCSDFMESIEMQKFSVKTDDLELDKLLSLMNDIDKNYTEHCEQLISKCKYYQVLQREAAQEITTLIQPLLPM
jgi:polysaccharide pyruvyl transferase WcaK-like protein